MKLFAVLVVVCLAVGSSSAWPWSKNEADFNGLNKHLLTKLADSEARKENLALIEADMNSFKPRVLKAAEVVLKLAEVNHNTQCDDQLLVTLRSASAGGMKSYSELKPKRRVEMLVRPELVMAMTTCTNYIEETFPKVVEAARPDLLKLSDMISPDNERHLYGKYMWPGSTYMARVLMKLARGDPLTLQNGLTKKSLLFEERQVFNYAYKKYLVEPCHKFIDTFNNLLRGTTAIANMQGHLRGFAEPRFDKLRRMARTNSLCRKIIWKGNDDEDTSSMYLAGYYYVL